MVEEKRPSLFQRLTRRTTPKPEDRTIYNPGIQEKDTSYLSEMSLPFKGDRHPSLKEMDANFVKEM